MTANNKSFDKPWTEEEVLKVFSDLNYVPTPWRAGLSVIHYEYSDDYPKLTPIRRVSETELSKVEAIYDIAKQSWEISIDTIKMKRSQETLCVGGPLAGQMEYPVIAEQQGYVRFNRNGNYNCPHKSILVHNSSL